MNPLSPNNGEQDMALSYKSLGRNHEGNIDIHDLHSAYLLTFNFYLAFWIFFLVICVANSGFADGLFF